MSLTTGLSRSKADGQWLCLLFCNTVENYRLAELQDYFTDFQRWLGLSLRHGPITEEQSEALSDWSQANPQEAEAALAAFKAFRLKLFRLFSARAKGVLPEPSQLEFLHAALPEALEQLRLSTQAGHISWRFEPRNSTDALFWPIVLSASELLTHPECDRLRQCSGDHCTWLFIDQSKNRSRRWCDMAICGNRAKSKRHYQKARQAAS